eukprot:441759-Hanusia_phi.AAC.1
MPFTRVIAFLSNMPPSNAQDAKGEEHPYLAKLVTSLLARRAILLLKRTTEQLSQDEDLRKVLAEFTSSASADSENEERLTCCCCSPKLLRVYGCFLASVGQRSMAAEQFETCMRLQPNSEHCILSYASLLIAGINQEVRHVELEKAKELLMRITKQNPNHEKSIKMLNQISSRFSESDFSLRRTENGYINVQERSGPVLVPSSSFLCPQGQSMVGNSPASAASSSPKLTHSPKSPLKEQEVLPCASAVSQLSAIMQNKSEMLADLTKCLNRYNEDVANITQLEKQNVFTKEEAHQQRQDALERFEKAKKLIMSGTKLSAIDGEKGKMEVGAAADDSDDDVDVDQLRRNTKKKFFFCVPIPSL